MVTATPQQVMMPLRPSNGLIIGLLAVAATMFLAGVIVLQARTLISAPSYYDPGYQNWVNQMKYIGFVGALLLDIGGFLMLLIGPYTALSRQDIPDRVRRALIGMSTAIGVAWLIGSFFISGMSISI